MSRLARNVPGRALSAVILPHSSPRLKSLNVNELSALTFLNERQMTALWLRVVAGSRTGRSGVITMARTVSVTTDGKCDR